MISRVIHLNPNEQIRLSSVEYDQTHLPHVDPGNYQQLIWRLIYLRITKQVSCFDAQNLQFMGISMLGHSLHQLLSHRDGNRVGRGGPPPNPKYISVSVPVLAPIPDPTGLKSPS